jgi:hypothetical protein
VPGTVEDSRIVGDVFRQAETSALTLSRDGSRVPPKSATLSVWSATATRSEGSTAPPSAGGSRDLAMSPLLGASHHRRFGAGAKGRSESWPNAAYGNLKRCGRPSRCLSQAVGSVTDARFRGRCVLANPLAVLARCSRLVAGWLSVSLRDAALCRAEEQFDRCPEHDQVQKHLHGHDHSCEVGLGGDVTEADG